MTLVDSSSDELQTIWQLVAELSAQLSANKELCASLQQQADQLKGQIHHNNTGFALRRFNVDVSKEKFSSELEKINVALVKENTALQQENKQLNQLLREHEQTLEAVMLKFRNFSHSTQLHILDLTQHYEGLLSAQSYSQASTNLQATTSTASTLTHLGDLVRRALRAVDGEIDDSLEDEDEYDEHELEEEAAASSVGGDDGASAHATASASGAKARLAAPPHAHSVGGHSASPSSASTSAASASRRRAHKNPAQYRVATDPRFYGSGGYFGKWGDPKAQRADAAMEALAEEEKLRAENDMLRKLLLIAEEPPLPPPLPVATDGAGAGGAGDLPPGVIAGGLPGSEKLSLGLPRGKMLKERQAQQQDGEESPPPGPPASEVPGTGSLAATLLPISTLLRTSPTQGTGAGAGASTSPTGVSGSGPPGAATSPTGLRPIRTLPLQTLKRSPLDDYPHADDMGGSSAGPGASLAGTSFDASGSGGGGGGGGGTLSLLNTRSGAELDEPSSPIRTRSSSAGGSSMLGGVGALSAVSTEPGSPPTVRLGSGAGLARWGAAPADADAGDGLLRNKRPSSALFGDTPELADADGEADSSGFGVSTGGSASGAPDTPTASSGFRRFDAEDGASAAAGADADDPDVPYTAAPPHLGSYEMTRDETTDSRFSVPAAGAFGPLGSGGDGTGADAAAPHVSASSAEAAHSFQTISLDDGDAEAGAAPKGSALLGGEAIEGDIADEIAPAPLGSSLPPRSSPSTSPGRIAPLPRRLSWREHGTSAAATPTPVSAAPSIDVPALPELPSVSGPALDGAAPVPPSSGSPPAAPGAPVAAAPSPLSQESALGERAREAEESEDRIAAAALPADGASADTPAAPAQRAASATAEQAADAAAETAVTDAVDGTTGELGLSLGPEAVEPADADDASASARSEES